MRPDDAVPIRTPVPCNGCRLCCINDLIVLHPECGDIIADYEYHEIVNPVTGQKAAALNRKPSGECVYLGPGGCTIYDRAPAICREFDCRRMYQKWTRPQRRMAIAKGLITKEILDAGRQRLDTL